MAGEQKYNMLPLDQRSGQPRATGDQTTSQHGDRDDQIITEEMRRWLAGLCELRAKNNFQIQLLYETYQRQLGNSPRTIPQTLTTTHVPSLDTDALAVLNDYRSRALDLPPTRNLISSGINDLSSKAADEFLRNAAKVRIVRDCSCDDTGEYLMEALREELLQPAKVLMDCMRSHRDQDESEPRCPSPPPSTPCLSPSPSTSSSSCSPPPLRLTEEEFNGACEAFDPSKDPFMLDRLEFLEKIAREPPQSRFFPRENNSHQASPIPEQTSSNPGPQSSSSSFESSNCATDDDGNGFSNSSSGHELSEAYELLYHTSI
ncbi:hypothetical protein F5Y07DRAFT_407904 [Xylaria sp. FL0933]|nr:hypothetical protein F5Y07DRAFT_407904 [Xylaria sp. FL0933]